MTRSRSILLSFLCLLILMSAFISNGTAINYGIGVKKEDVLVWKCNVCNKDEMTVLFGDNWVNSGLFEGLTKGKMMKWEIINTKVNAINIEVEVDLWLWSKGDEWGNKDRTFQIMYLSDPKTYKEELDFSNTTFFVPFLFPVPISEYLGNLKLIEWYDVDNRVLTTVNVLIPKDLILSDYPSKDITIIAIYNERGILTSYKLYRSGNIVIIDISFDKLPFFVIPTLVSLTICLSIGIVIYIIRRKQLNKNY